MLKKRKAVKRKAEKTPRKPGAKPRRPGPHGYEAKLIARYILALGRNRWEDLWTASGANGLTRKRRSGPTK